MGYEGFSLLRMRCAVSFCLSIIYLSIHLMNTFFPTRESIECKKRIQTEHGRKEEKKKKRKTAKCVSQTTNHTPETPTQPRSDQTLDPLLHLPYSYPPLSRAHCRKDCTQAKARSSCLFIRLHLVASKHSHQAGKNLHTTIEVADSAGS